MACTRFRWRAAPWIAIAVGLLGLARPVTAGQDTAAPTFTKDIAPIFQEKCRRVIGLATSRRCRW